MATRIPYLNDWTLSYGVRNASGTLIQPTSISCTVTNANGSAVSVGSLPAWDAATSTTLLSLTNTEVGASAYATRWTLTWSGTASGTDFTDVEYAVIVKGGEESWHTTVYDAKLLLNVTSSGDDALISELIGTATDTLSTLYDLPTVPKVTETRYFYPGNALILLDECNSVTAVADESGNAFTTDDYTLLYKKRGTLKGMLLESPCSGRVAITGSWGFDSTPSDVARALNIAVSTWYKRAKLGDSNDIVGGFSTLPRETRDIMDARVVATI